MSSILMPILTALAGLPGVLDGLKLLITAIGSLFDGVAANHPDGVNKVDAIVQNAKDIVSFAETEVGMADKWLLDRYPSVNALLNDFTGLGKLLYSSHNVAADQNVSHHVALTSVQLAANNLKVGADVPVDQIIEKPFPSIVPPVIHPLPPVPPAENITVTIGESKVKA